MLLRGRRGQQYLHTPARTTTRPTTRPPLPRDRKYEHSAQSTKHPPPGMVKLLRRNRSGWSLLQKTSCLGQNETIIPKADRVGNPDLDPDPDLDLDDILGEVRAFQHVADPLLDQVNVHRDDGPLVHLRSVEADSLRAAHGIEDQGRRAKTGIKPQPGGGGVVAKTRGEEIGRGGAWKLMPGCLGGEMGI